MPALLLNCLSVVARRRVCPLMGKRPPEPREEDEEEDEEADEEEEQEEQ